MAIYKSNIYFATTKLTNYMKSSLGFYRFVLSFSQNIHMQGYNVLLNIYNR